MTLLESIAIIANHSFPDQRAADAAQLLIRRALQASPAPSDGLREVVEAMARFDGRNNNKHLKDMARAALSTSPAPEWTVPPVETRPDGFTCLAFINGRWEQARYDATHEGWQIKYGGGFFDPKHFAPLPKEPNHD